VRVDDQSDLTERRTFSARKRIAIGVGVLGMVLVLSAAGYLAWDATQNKNTPERAVSGIASAAMKGDADKVAASLDTSAIVNSAVDEVFSSTEETHAVLSEYLKTHPDVTESQVKAKARATLDQEIREHVESGTLPKRIPIGSSSLKALAAQAYARGSVRSVRVDGDVAHVVVAVPYKGKTLNVKVRMRRAGDTWKIDKIENLADVLKQAGY
jgi:hypothetical protein